MTYAVHAAASIGVAAVVYWQLQPVGLVPAVVCALACWNGGLWPDADHPSTAVSRRHPFTRTVFTVFHGLVLALLTPPRWRKRLQGHRTFSHSPYGMLLSLSVSAIAARGIWEVWVWFAVLFPALAFFDAGAVGIADPRWVFCGFVSASFLIGQSVHLVLDWPTESGLPLGLPVTTRRYRLPLRIRMDTTHFAERRRRSK